MVIFLPNSQLMPHDPSTLALAIVGIATLAVYLAATGWRPGRCDRERPPRPKLDASARPGSDHPTETPTRDAA